MTMAQTYENFGNYQTEYGRDYICPSGRLYVHSSVYLPSSELDPRTGLLKPDVRRQGRTQAKRMEYESLSEEFEQINKEFSQYKGKPSPRMSLRTAILLIALTAFLASIYYLSLQGTLVTKNAACNRLAQAIEQCAKVNDGIAEEIEAASDETTICYAAAQYLNMIPAEAAQAIHLVAVDTRPMGDGKTTYATADAAAQPENTAIPAVASVGTGY